MSLSREQIVRCLLDARSRLSASAWLIVHDAHTTEELFQDAMVKVLDEELGFEGEAQLISWAQVVMRNAALNWARRRQSRQVPLDADVLEMLEAEWARKPAASSGGRLDALRDCLDALPLGSRRLLESRYFEGRSCGEVSRILGVSLSAVYQRLSRLHQALKGCIERRRQGSQTTFEPEMG
jgi:RNA polymerase sigma factor (sigma-70 family)